MFSSIFFCLALLACLHCPSAAVTDQTGPWPAVVHWTRCPHDRPAAVDNRATDETISAAVTDQTDPWPAVVHWTRCPHDRPAAVDHRATDETISAAVDHRATDETISATAYDHFYDEAEREEIDDDNISIHIFLPIILIAMFLLMYPILYCSCNSRKQKVRFIYRRVAVSVQRIYSLCLKQ
ncbi:unnamed protein product [Aphis gossypii]|uniref:Uncharacterized protein n=1 Tax=Aphis gossypii TaxID=80765 RepID=A0A9P0JER2_APHGO|nr:unnamed protein product [Aphis gossypii]